LILKLARVFRGADEAREGDFARIQSARDHAYGSRAVGRAYLTFYQAAESAEVTSATWARIFDPLEPVHALVAERDDRLIGFSHYLFQRSTWLLNPQCYLQDLYVGEDKRGRGVGRALIGAVVGAAKEAGAPRVFWNTHETNAVARRLYDAVAKRTGFIQYRIEPLG
jgi:GNAT superfamily N-acetyltransferase